MLPCPGSSGHEMPIGFGIPQALARTLFPPLRDVPPPELLFVGHERASPRSLAPSAYDQPIDSGTHVVLVSVLPEQVLPKANALSDR